MTLARSVFSRSCVRSIISPSSQPARGIPITSRWLSSPSSSSEAPSQSQTIQEKATNAANDLLREYGRPSSILTPTPTASASASPDLNPHRHFEQFMTAPTGSSVNFVDGAPRPGYTPSAIPPKEDPLLDLFTNLLMKHGRKAEAQKRVSEVMRLM